MSWRTAIAVPLALVAASAGPGCALRTDDHVIALSLPRDTQESIWKAIPAHLELSHKEGQLVHVHSVDNPASLHVTLIRFSRALSPQELDRVRQVAEAVVGAHDRIDLTEAITGAHLGVSHDERWIELNLKETDGVRSLGRMSQRLADEIARQVKGVTPEKERDFHIRVAYIDAKPFAGVDAPFAKILIALYSEARVDCPRDAPHAVHLKRSIGDLSCEDVGPPIFFAGAGHTALLSKPSPTAGLR